MACLYVHVDNGGVCLYVFSVFSEQVLQGE